MASTWQKFKGWFRNRVVNPFIEYMKQDTEPKVLARSATLGFFLGLCPIVGVSMLMCIAICFVFSSYVFAPMALLANFVAVPFELLLIIPYMRFGELILRAEPVNVIPKHFKDLFKAGEALKGLGHAVLGWLIIIAVLYWPVSFLLTPFFAFLKHKFSSMRRADSDEGPLMDGMVEGESDVEMAGSLTPSGSLNRPTLSPRSSREQISPKDLHL